MDVLIPQGLQQEDFIDHIAKFSYGDLIEKIVENGFNHIELSGDLVILLPHFYLQESINKLGELKLKFNLTYSVHLPLWSVEPSTPLLPVREGSVVALIDHINRLKPLEPEVYVLHATGALAAEFYRMKMPGLAKEFLLSQIKNHAKESIGLLLKDTGVQSRKIAIETVEFPFELTHQIADEMDLSICFDTGHVLAGFSGPIDFFNTLERCLPRLAEIHLHDCPHHSRISFIQYGKDHQSLGRGDLNIGKFFDFLLEVDFSGPVVFELRIEEALESLDILREIRPGIKPKH